MNRRFLFFAAVCGALAVVAGAMLTHQLRDRMPARALDAYEVAVRYQFYHVFALLAAGVLAGFYPGRWNRWSGNCFIFGIILFCGSLYVIAAIMTNGADIPRALGLLTPLGGAGFILGWIFLALSVRNEKSAKAGSGSGSI